MRAAQTVKINGRYYEPGKPIPDEELAKLDKKYPGTVRQLERDHVIEEEPEEPEEPEVDEDDELEKELKHVRSLNREDLIAYAKDELGMEDLDLDRNKPEILADVVAKVESLYEEQD